MRKILGLMVFGALLIAQSISNVHLVPSKTSYFVGNQVSIHWSYTGLSIPSTAKVKITLWRQGASQNICLIAQNVPISNGSSGHSWTIPSTCVNPHTSATEDLTRGNLKVRIRWQGHTPAVYGETGWFTVQFPQKAITNVRLTPYRNTYNSGERVTVSWNYSGIPSGDLVKITLWKEGASESSCLVADNIRISTKQKSWRTMSSCINPRTGVKEKLTSKRLRLRVRWKGHPIWGESSWFKINPVFSRINPAPLNPQGLKVAPVYDFEIADIHAHDLYCPSGVCNKLGGLDVKIKNNGILYSGNLKFRIIGMDKFMGGKYAYDKTVEKYISLMPGEEKWITLIERSIPWNEDICSINFAVKVDPKNKVHEKTENNNLKEKRFFRGELVRANTGRIVCGIEIYPRLIKIGKANLRPVPQDGQIVIPSDRINIYVPFRNCCSQTKTLDVSFVYDWTPLLKDGENKVVWHSKITLAPGEERGLIFTGLKIPRRKEFKNLVIRSYEVFKGQGGYGILYKIKVRVD